MRTTTMSRPADELATTAPTALGELGATGERASESPSMPARYIDLGPVGRGGFGEVRRGRDTLLDRIVAIKVMHADIAMITALRRRFFAEVQITASLQHPGVVPIYDFGELRDGRLWYAMKDVRGATLARALDERRVRSDDSDDGGSSLRRVVDAIERVAQTVAFAHARGVIHRDVKPANVMLGEFGEVLLMDWGLALRTDDERSDERDPTTDAHDDVAPRDDRASLTRPGSVLGTPAYMPLEQALGDRALHGPPSDVYALGAVLYHALALAPPYEGPAAAVLEQLLAGPPLPIASRAQRDTPEELRALCERAMQRDPRARCSAESCARDVRAGLDGARRRAQARERLAAARASEPELARLRAEARDAHQSARARWATLRPFDPVEDKRPAWALEDHARTRARDAAIAEARWLEHVRAALSVDPECSEAHAALAAHYRDALREAERARREDDAARCEAMLRTHDRGEHRAFLRGDGHVELVTEPPGARVFCARFALEDRRLVARERVALGVTPLRDAALAHGSYALEIEAPGRATVRYPVVVERDGRWRCGPNEDPSQPLALPSSDDVGEDEALVPASWAWLGGDLNAPDSLPLRRVWIASFVLRKDPVTVREYLAFLDDLVARGRRDEALAALPKAGMGSALESAGAATMTLDERGRFTPSSDPLWRPEMPVVLVSWRSAVAYARWLSERTGLPWRLPNELEREKAARGVDGRAWPWGDHGDPTFARVLDGQRDEPAREPVGIRLTDTSPYGVRGLAGNTRDWCANAWTHQGPRLVDERLALEQPEDNSDEYRAIRGGFWAGPINSSRAAARFGARPDVCRSSVGFRLARSLDA